MSVTIFAMEDLLFAPINVSTLGDNIVISPQTKRIRVFHVVFVPSGSITVQWKSDVNVISGPIPLVASAGYSTSFQYGFMQTGNGQALILNLSGSAPATIGGSLAYVLF